MANRWTEMDERHLGQVLSSAAEQAFPPTPDIAGTVRSRIQSGQEPEVNWYRRMWSSVRRHPALATAATIVLALVVSISAFTSVPAAVADRLGVPGIEITSGPSWDDLELTPVAGSGLELGESMMLDEARERAPFEIRVPDYDLTGAPDEVYVGMLGEVPLVSLTYDAGGDLRPAEATGLGLLVTQFPAELADEPLVTKGLSGESVATQVNVNQSAGYWLTGQHTFRYQTDADDHGTEQTRLAGNVLLWEEDGFVYRIEGARSLTLDDALAIAESMSEE